MKKPPFRHVTSLLILLFPMLSVAQNSLSIPEDMEFAGIKIHLNEDAQRIVDQDVKALKSNRNFLNAKLERMSLYLPIIEPILEAEGIPNDFKYLAVQESSLQPDAVSKSNAVGFWQFKRDTAFDFGLRVDEQVDERKNIHASTRAACLYLKRNNQVLNNWVASLLSYRLGLGSMSKVLPKTWYHTSEVSVDKTTDFYILRALAHKLALEQEFTAYEGSKYTFFEYAYGSGKSIMDLAKELLVSEEDVRKYNRWLSVYTIPEDKDYMVIVPLTKEQIATTQEKVMSSNGKIDVFKADVGFPLLRKITEGKTEIDDAVFFEINGKRGIQAQIGDDIESLAERANISPAKLMKYNDLKDDAAMILPTDVYYLEKKDKVAQVPFHTVVDGQTLWQISQMYGVKLECLLKNNRFEQAQRLQVGRVMWLAKKRPESTPVEVIHALEERKNIESASKVVETKPIILKENIIAKSPNKVSLPPTSTKIIDITFAENSTIETAKIIEEVSDNQIIKQSITKNIQNHIHHISAGETLYSIARKYNVSVSELASWNKLTRDAKLLFGTKLLIKNGTLQEPISLSSTSAQR
jgi:membrane-bound lytic murein transglycosylase D